MWLPPGTAAAVLKDQKNGFLVSKNPGNHAAHTNDLRARMPVAKELAKATDAAAEAASLSDFDLARAAKVARDEGLDPRHALAASFDNGMAKALEKFRDRVVDVAARNSPLDFVLNVASFVAAVNPKCRLRAHRSALCLGVVGDAPRPLIPDAQYARPDAKPAIPQR